MRGKLLATACGLLVAGTAFCAPNEVNFVPGQSYEKEGARWSDRLSRREFGYPPDCGDCVIDALMIRNDSASELRCAISVRYPQPNDAGVADISATEIIAPNSERSVVHALNVPRQLAATSFGSDCSPLPPLPPLDKPENCTMKISGVNPADFYPAGSVRRNEQGKVTGEFTLAEEKGKATDIVILRGSEHPDLDAAALQLFTRATMTTNCPGTRFRLSMPFRLKE
jgi:TonB family protein